MRAFLLLMVLVAAASQARADDAAPAAEPVKADAVAAEGNAAASDDKKADEKKADESKKDEKKADEAAGEPKKDEAKAEPAADTKKDTAPAAEVEAPSAPTAPAAQVNPETGMGPGPAAMPGTPETAPAAATSSTTAEAKPGEAKAGETAKPEASHRGLHYGIGVTVFSAVASSADLQGGYVGLSPNVSYGLSDTMTVSGAFSPAVNFKWPGSAQSVPDGNRRFDNNPGFSALRISARDLYTDEFSGVHLNGNIAYFMPLDWNNLFGENKTLGDLGAALSLTRSFGNLGLSLNGGAKLFGWTSAMPPKNCAAETGYCDRGTAFGAYNPMYALNTSVSAGYEHGAWSGRMTLGLSRTATYGPSSANEPRNTNDHANLKYGSVFSASAGYSLTDELSVSGGLFNGGPQITSIDGYNNPFFKDQFAGLFVGMDWSH